VPRKRLGGGQNIVIDIEGGAHCVMLRHLMR
jgi:hypothetical protein